jgi:hypothetical protein
MTAGGLLACSESVRLRNLSRLGKPAGIGQQQEVPVERISFIDALRWLAQGGVGRTLDQLIVLPNWPGRAEARVVQRRPKQYTLMRRPRAALQQTLTSKRLAA